MTFMNKLLTYLGFCPSKESAQRFRVRNKITLEQSVVGVGFILILILLVNASNVLAGEMTVNTILRLFSISVFSLILVIVAVGGLKVRARFARDPWFFGFTRDPWLLAKMTFVGTFIGVLVQGATTGFFFISPTDGWVEIIAEALAVSLMVMVVEVLGTAYFRSRKDK